MKKIAITGSLATGKTTVLKILEKLGFSTFSCDDVVKKLYELPEIQKEIIKIFGKEILTKYNKINKKKILKKITENSELKKRLENIFHPLVKKELLKFIKEKEKTEKIVFAEVPLLFEANWKNLFDEIWVISCDVSVQKKRIIEKGLEEKLGEKILELQLPLKIKEKRAHRIINSNKSLNELEREIKEILKGYLKD